MHWPLQPAPVPTEAARLLADVLRLAEGVLGLWGPGRPRSEATGPARRGGARSGAGQQTDWWRTRARALALRARIAGLQPLLGSDNRRSESDSDGVASGLGAGGVVRRSTTLREPASVGSCARRTFTTPASGVRVVWNMLSEDSTTRPLTATSATVSRPSATRIGAPARRSAAERRNSRLKVQVSLATHWEGTVRAGLHSGGPTRARGSHLVVVDVGAEVNVAQDASTHQVGMDLAGHRGLDDHAAVPVLSLPFRATEVDDVVSQRRPGAEERQYGIEAHEECAIGRHRILIPPPARPRPRPPPTGPAAGESQQRRPHGIRPHASQAYFPILSNPVPFCPSTMDEAPALHGVGKLARSICAVEGDARHHRFLAGTLCLQEDNEVGAATRHGPPAVGLGAHDTRRPRFL